MNFKVIKFLLISFLLPTSHLIADEMPQCESKLTIDSEDQLENGVKNYLACLKLVSSQFDLLAKNLGNTSPLQLATHSVNRAKFYNVYAKAMTVYGKFQLEYMTYFMNNFRGTENISKSSFLLSYLESNQLVQDLENISLSEDQRFALLESGKSINEYIENHFSNSSQF